MGLTVREIDSAKPNDKPYKLADSGGLCLLIATSGAKLWRWRYRFDGKEKMMAMGEYPLVTLNRARELHFAARKTLATGSDPMAERKAETETKQKRLKRVSVRQSRVLKRLAESGGLGGRLANRPDTQRR